LQIKLIGRRAQAPNGQSNYSAAVSETGDGGFQSTVVSGALNKKPKISPNQAGAGCLFESGAFAHGSMA
jgi:hypothetical protein